MTITHEKPRWSDTFDNYLVFINGRFSKELSILDTIPAAVSISSLLLGGISLHVGRDCVVTKPLHIVFYNTQQHMMSPCNIITVDDNAELTVVEEYISTEEASVTHAHTTIYAGKNARVRFHKIQDEHDKMKHIANLFVHQQDDSDVTLFTFSKGAAFSRENVVVNLLSRGATCHVLGLNTLYHDNQQADHYVLANHMAPLAKSAMLYKGIVDKKSKGVFNGKVHVHPNATSSIASQANHYLLLSKEAEVKTKPELEIYTDDVKCTHGATTGQLNEDLLFYLRSRGIPYENAVTLLVDAFLDEVICFIQDESVRGYMKERAGRHVEL